MEIAMGCGFAKVTVNDSNSVEVVSFENVKVMGGAGFCGGDVIGPIDGFGREFQVNRGKGNYIN